MPDLRNDVGAEKDWRGARRKKTLELKSMTRRFWIGLALTVPVLILSMGEFVPGLRDLIHSLGRTNVVWAEFILSTPVVLWAGWPFFERGGRSLVTRHLNMFTLISMGTGAAYSYSVVATCRPPSFPRPFAWAAPSRSILRRQPSSRCLFSWDRFSNSKPALPRAQRSKPCLGLAPKTARLVKEDGSETDVPLEQVKVGDRLRVRPGEKVPVDGIVQEWPKRGG
jgi:cation transport ATPase